MCVVHAPFWKGTYNMYGLLSDFIGRLTPPPRIIVVQGGEVLTQEKTLNFLFGQKNKNPGTQFYLITNGNVKGKIINKVKKLFSAMTISIVGFQKQTYTTIMSLDIDTVKYFVEEMTGNSNVEINLKFLTTPLNIHEICLFLDWALPLHPQSIDIADANTAHYINMSTEIPYWNVVRARAGKELMRYLQDHQQQFLAHKIRLCYPPSLFGLLKIEQNHLKAMKVAGLLLPTGGHLFLET
jgi:hypothetical protein